MTKPLLLIVDDNQDNLQVLAGHLEHQDYSIALSSRSLEAISFASQEKVDLVLLDIMMPEMDGYEVCRILKNSAVTKWIPVIFITARNDTQSLVKGFEVGAVDYITKPFNPPELRARVKTHLELKRAREEIRVLKGLLPICSGCKSIRNEHNEWEPMESYISKRSEVDFSHGLCPECIRTYYPKLAERLSKEW